MEPKELKKLLIGIYDLIDENSRLQIQSQQLVQELEKLNIKSSAAKNMLVQEQEIATQDELYALGEEKIKDMVWPDLINDYDITSFFVCEKDNLTIISFEQFLDKLFRSNYFDYEGNRLIGLISYSVFTKLFHTQLFRYYEELVTKALKKIASPKNDNEDEEENEGDADSGSTNNE